MGTSGGTIPVSSLGFDPATQAELDAAIGSYISMRPTAKSADYSAVVGDLVLMSGTHAVTLPGAAAAGTVIAVKKTDVGPTQVTVSPASGTIDGAASVVIYARYQQYTFVSDGANWWVN